MKCFGENGPFPELARRPTILVDDGLASGFTMFVAVEAVRRTGAEGVMVAVPTGHEEAVATQATQVSAVYCVDIRSGPVFAVAAAYQDWTDASEAEALRILGGGGDRESVGNVLAELGSNPKEDA